MAPAVWFRLGVGITVATGVSAWADKSGNGRNLVQATGGNQPALQTDRTILFDGTDDFLATAGFTLAQPVTVYFLGKQVTWTANDTLFDGVAGNDLRCYQLTATPNISFFGGLDGCASAALAVDTYGVVAAVFSGTNSLSQVNGGAVVTGSLGTASPGGFTLGAFGAGAAAWGNVRAKETMLFPQAHGSEIRERVRYYMNSV